MAGTGPNYALQEMEQRRRLAMGQPRLVDRLQDDPATRQSPDLAPDYAPGYGTGSLGSSTTGSAPPQPRLAQRVLGGFEAQPGGGTGGLVGRVARGALSGALGPTQRQDIEAERLGSQRVAGELATGAQRGGQEMALERQREAYGQPEQEARIEQQRLASKILERRLAMMQGAGTGEGLQDLNDDENALLQSAYATGDPKIIEQAVGRIYSRRSIEGMVGPGTNVYDPNSPGGVSRQFMTRGGQPMPGATQQGAVVPGTLPRTSTTEQLVPTQGGGMAAVTKPTTTTPQLPGQPRTGGGPNVQNIPVQPRMPAQEQRARDTATVALSQFPTIRNELEALQQRLGPIGGREQEIGVSIGAADPQYVQLRTDVGLATSALSVIHFGARGNWQWLQDFKRNIDTGRLSYPALKAGLATVRRWLQAYQQIGDTPEFSRSRFVDDGAPAPGVRSAR